MNTESNKEYKYDIFSFLDEHIVENGKVHTHTSMRSEEHTSELQSQR